MNEIGLPARIRMNDLSAHWRSIRSEAIEAIDRVGHSGWLILGGEVAAFEGELAGYLGVHACVGVGNATDGLEIALRALGLGAGDAVITTPLSAFATTLAIARAGARPVFVDTDEAGLLDLDRAANALESDPTIRAIVPVHLYGHPADLRRLERLAETQGILVIEDCAQAIGATHNGVMCGTVGDLSVTSFYPTKNLAALGDGGAVFGSDSRSIETVRQLRDYGQTSKYVHDRLGLNSRLDELHAAVLRSAILPHLEKSTTRRRQVAASYLEGIRNPHLVPIRPAAFAQSVWHLFPVRVAGDRDLFRRHLATLGIETSVHYPRLIPDQSALQSEDFDVVGALTNARSIAGSVVSLPVHPYLTTEDVDLVVDACNRWEGK